MSKRTTKSTDPETWKVIPRSAAEVLLQASETYAQRNAIYGDNFTRVGPIMKILFPEGVPADLLGSDQFHLFELVIVKISRLANSGLTHNDSAHDAAVYCAMIEAAIAGATQ